MLAFYRSILLNNRIAQHHHRFLRSRLMVAGARLLRASQCGGLPHKGVDMASLLVRSFDAFAGVARRSTLKVFMDVRTAYYSAVRELFVDLPAFYGGPRGPLWSSCRARH